VIHSAALFAALGPLVGNRCYPVMFPQEPLPAWPAIRYTPVGGTVYPDACGGGDGAEDDQRVQIDMVADTYDAAAALCVAVRAARALLDPPAVPDGPAQYLFDAETKTMRAIQDFTLYPSSAEPTP